MAKAGSSSRHLRLVPDRPAAEVGEGRGWLVKHARHHWLLLAQSKMTRRLLASMGRRIEALPLPTG
jgi:hypothetical protein